MTCLCRSHGSFLTAKGLEEAAQRELVFAAGCAMGLTPDVHAVRLDKSGSVSASEPMSFIFDDDVLEEQYRRFHNGS